MTAPLQSMTGFGSAEIETNAGRVRCVARSVNGKGLDIKLRLPQGQEASEIDIKKRLGAIFMRGNIQISVTMDDKQAQAPALAIDEKAFFDLARQASMLATQAGLAPPTADSILVQRGVVTAGSDEPVDDADIHVHINHAIDAASAQLLESRRNEGDALARILTTLVDEMALLVQSASREPAAKPEAIAEKLRTQITQLLADQSELDVGRLNAEAAILATKADIREELDRLMAHIDSARALLAKGDAVGRQLDFLTQEFNREANTLCAKSSSAALTAIGLQMKSVIDQLREQVQNLQ